MSNDQMSITHLMFKPKNLPFLSLVFGLGFVTASFGCGKAYQALAPASEQAATAIGCDSLESKMYDTVYSGLKDQDRFISVDELTAAFAKSIPKQFPSWSEMQVASALSTIKDFYSQLPLKPQSVDDTPRDVLKRVLRAEMGVRSTDETKATQDQLISWRAQYDGQKIYFDNSACQSNGSTSTPVATSPTPTATPQSTPTAVVTSAVDPIVYNARKVMMTAYQNCAAGELPPMDASVPNVSGISIIGQNGAGYLRTISSLASVNSSDYYLKGLRLPASSCFDVSKNPLIYNFGGKPYATSDQGSALNLFIEAGGGSNTLGIDCSGYVVSVVASSGLRFSPNQDVKPLLVEAINSTMFTDPANNGMSCFNKVSMGTAGTLAAGDVVGTNGHVFIIDSVAKDPMGVNAVTADSQCNSITSDKFDFIIAQSDPSKNGIGINRIQATYYLSYTSEFKSGFETYAKAACHAKFANTNVLTTTAGITVIRHNHTAACLSTRPVPLDGVQCISSCPALTAMSSQL